MKTLRQLPFLLPFVLCLCADVFSAEGGPAIQNSAENVNSNTPAAIALKYTTHVKNTNALLTFALVTKPQHGTLVLPEPYHANQGARNATYVSAKDYAGEDTFTWKLSEGAAESSVATCTINVNAKPPFPKIQTVYTLEGTAIDIPAVYSGGGGFVYSIKAENPAHGKVTIDGTTFHYTPDAHFTGADWITWSMSYSSSKDPKATPSLSRSATCWVVIKPANMNDWPQWRADECRSGFTSMALPPALQLQWRRDQPATLSPFCTPDSTALHFNQGQFVDLDYCRPVQMGKQLFVPSTYSDSVSAYHTDTGALQWRYYANGAVRRPPVAMALPGGDKVVLFGSDDGWIYCLNAADGTERWKFRGAPNTREAMGFNRLASVWPIWASPVARDGKIYFAAGYVSSFGLYAYCLDAATGAVVWVNDGRISDMWNTSAFGPLAFSYDKTRLYGSVEGSCRPWVLDSTTGEFLGHLGVGFTFPGVLRVGANGWYVDGKGTFVNPIRKWRSWELAYDDPEPLVVNPPPGFKDLWEGEQNEPEPKTITVGSRTIGPADVAELGVKGTVASILAGDGKLFVTTAEGGIYCFGGTQAKPELYPYKPTPLPVVTDEWTTAAKTMLSQKNLNQGLALVCGVKNGRLVEELAKQSSLTIVAVDADHKKLQALRARMDAAGISAERVSILEGNPLDFRFSPYIAALVTSEDPEFTAAAGKPEALERLYASMRAFGGEIWLPTSDQQHTALAAAVAASKKMPLSEVQRTGAYTQIRRTGMTEANFRVKPPFGLVSYGGSYWKDFNAYYRFTKDMEDLWPVASKPRECMTGAKVSTEQSIFTSLRNPLYSLVEKFPGLPGSGNDWSCTDSTLCRGDFGLIHGKVASFFDASANYWGRLFVTQSGNCRGETYMWKGLIGFYPNAWPGGFCGCVAASQFTSITLAPMDGEENWVEYQTARSSNPVEERPIQKVGINFGAPGDLFLSEEGMLWTHHPFAGHLGLVSHNIETTSEALPLVPVSYSGPVRSVYHNSAQMVRTGSRVHDWVSPSQVLGMTSLSVYLAQPVVAQKIATAPKLDGDLNKDCWKQQKCLTFEVNRIFTDLVKDTGQPKPDEHCYASVCYDDTNLYIAGGVHAGFGNWLHMSKARWQVLHDEGLDHAKTFEEWFKKQTDRRRQVVVKLNNRERVSDEVVLTGLLIGNEQKMETSGLNPRDNKWSFAASATDSDPFMGEIAIPWKVLAAAGLWKEQLIINISVAGSSLTPAYTPLYLDAARGAVTETHPHTVRLYFSEMEGKAPGQRVFDVSLQGKKVQENLDVVKEAGGPKREWVKEFKNISISGELDIGFTPHAGEAMLSGVEIVGNYSAADHAPHAAPSAKIEASTLSGPAPLDVTFSARSSSAPGGQIVECAWETGDGRLARGSVLHHVFAEPGTYQVHLLVRDNCGALASDSITVTVQPGVPAAFVSAIRAKDGDYTTLSAWETAMRSDLTQAAMLFKVSPPSTYATADDGAAVKFTGGGTGMLKHINGSSIAYIVKCTGPIKPGAVTCASGHTFNVDDTGHPIYAMVAECHNDWPAGLQDKVAPVAEKDASWRTDALRCVTIRAAAGSEHHGVLKNATEKGQCAGFTLKGDLDLSLLPNTRVCDLTLSPESTLTSGVAVSVLRVMAGTVLLREDGMAANSVASTFIAGNMLNTPYKSISFSNQNRNRVWLTTEEQQNLKNIARPHFIDFFNCTGATFDPGTQPSVSFINCLAAPGGKGFHDARSPEGAYANHCVSTNASATIWDSGDGSEGNVSNQTVSFQDAAGGDYRLLDSDKGARGRGAPGLGADIAGTVRSGTSNDVGAYTTAKNTGGGK